MLTVSHHDDFAVILPNPRTNEAYDQTIMHQLIYVIDEYTLIKDLI